MVNQVHVVTLLEREIMLENHPVLSNRLAPQTVTLGTAQEDSSSIEHAIIQPGTNSGLEPILTALEQNHGAQLYHYLLGQKAIPTAAESVARPGPLPYRPSEIASYVA